MAEQVGSLVINIEAGVAKLQRDMDAMRSNVTTNMAAVRRDTAQTLEAVERAGQQTASSVDKSFGSAASAVKGFIAVYSGMRLVEFAQDATLAAARYSTMGAVMENVGKNAGYSAAELHTLETRLRETGISATESRNNITKVVQAHIDLADATKLSRVAQDAAVIGNLNSSEAFSQLIHGVQTAQIDVLRGIGLNVDFEGSYTKLAVTLGKSTAALTENEKMQARVNEVMERGKDIAGTYDAAMGEAGKQLNSMKRYADDLKVALGQQFMGPFTQGVSSASSAMKYLSHHAEELGQALEYSLVGVGLVALGKASGGLQQYVQGVVASQAAVRADAAAHTQAAVATEQHAWAMVQTVQASKAVIVAEADKAAAIVASARAEMLLAEQELARAGLQARLAQGTAAQAAQQTVLASAEARLVTAREAESVASAALATAEGRLAAAREVATAAAAGHAAASNALTAAKEREAAASSLAAAAGRAAGSVMAMLGGPIGVATIAIAALIINWDKLADRSVRAADMATDSANRIKAALAASNSQQAGDEVAKAKQRLALANENMAQAMKMRDSSKDAPKLYEHYDQQFKQWAAIADEARDVSLKGEVSLKQFKETQRKQGLALVGLDENGQPIAPHTAAKDPNYKLGGQLRDRYTGTADKIKEDIANIKQLVADGVYTKEEGAKLLADADEKLANALKGKKGRTGLSSQDSAVAGLRGRIEEEKRQIAELTAADGGQVEKLSEGKRKVIEIEQRLRLAKDASTQASLRSQLVLAKELDTLNQQTLALQKAQKIRSGMYDTPLERSKREHAERVDDIAKAKLTPEEKARYGQREDKRYERERMDMRSSERSEFGLDKEEEQIRTQYERRHQLIMDATTLTEEERTEYLRRSTEKLNVDLTQLEQNRTSSLLQGSAQLFDGLAGMAENFRGKNSAIYKAMFAASKAFAIADSIIKIQQAIAAAAASGPFPANLGAMATVASATMGLVSTISGTKLSGMAHEGIDNIPREGTWLLDKGERVVDSRTNADLKTYLQRVSEPRQGSGEPVTAPAVTVTVLNQATGAQATAEQRTNADGSREIMVMIRNAVDQRLAESTREGGQLYDFVRRGN